MPFHYVGGANWLTNDALDAISKTPEYKVCTVRVEKMIANDYVPGKQVVYAR